MGTGMPSSKGGSMWQARQTCEKVYLWEGQTDVHHNCRLPRRVSADIAVLRETTPACSIQSVHHAIDLLR